jgi:hypothetical protein
MQTRDQLRGAEVRQLSLDLPDPNPCLIGIIQDWARKRGQDLSRALGDEPAQ